MYKEIQRKAGYLASIGRQVLGIESYRQIRLAGKLQKASGEEMDFDKSPIVASEAAFTVALLPAAIYVSASADESKGQEVLKTPQKITRGLKLLAAVGYDISPLIAALIARHPLPLLAKPVLNALVHIARDMGEAKKFKETKNHLPKAEEGTYAFLEKVLDESYDKNLDAGIVRDSQGNIIAVVSKEAICVATGGSCMDIVMPKTEGKQKWMDHAHVTEEDLVVANVSSKRSTEVAPITPPDIRTLVSSVKEVFLGKDN